MENTLVTVITGIHAYLGKLLLILKDVHQSKTDNRVRNTLEINSLNDGGFDKRSYGRSGLFQANARFTFEIGHSQWNGQDVTFTTHNNLYLLMISRR
jgi:hypothetical protein